MNYSKVNQPPISYNMLPYSGPWTKDQAAHLLRRTMFGATFQQITSAVSSGMNATVANLLQIPIINPPLAYEAAETEVPLGTTWVNAVYPADAAAAQLVENTRLKSLAAWYMGRINHENLSIAEKICMFWHNHFACTLTSDSRITYNYYNLIRTHALGNFKQLVKDVTIDPCMLLFLNGATNTLYSPNENYAREILELFTIGKGDQIGPGDYTNYKEEDVAAGAKIFTGYLVDGIRSNTITNPTANFNAILHDPSSKQLSSHFGSAIVANQGANEYSAYIDIIFQQTQVAHFICKKLYRYFVNYDLTSDVETNVIPEMAATMIANNYEILPVLDQLFKSEHFYDVALRGSIIKGPLEFVFSMLNNNQAAPNFSLAVNSDMYLSLYWLAENMSQGIATPPSVAGWPAYYQAPAFSQLWMNSNHIKSRFDLAGYITVYTGIPVSGNNFKVNALQLVDGLSNPSDALTVINDLCTVFFSKPISFAQIFTLKAILTNGQPDTEWTIQYTDYINNPGNTTFSTPVKTRIEYVLYKIFQMPEFHVI